MNDVITGLGSDGLKVIAVIGVAGCGAIAAAIRWATNRITKSIDEAAAAQTVAADRAATAQLVAADRFAAAAQAQAVALAELRSDIRAVTEFIHDRPSSRIAGSGGRHFTPSPDR